MSEGKKKRNTYGAEFKAEVDLEATIAKDRRLISTHRCRPARDPLAGVLGA